MSNRRIIPKIAGKCVKSPDYPKGADILPLFVTACKAEKGFSLLPLGKMITNQ